MVYIVNLSDKLEFLHISNTALFKLAKFAMTMSKHGMLLLFSKWQSQIVYVLNSLKCQYVFYTLNF